MITRAELQSTINWQTRNVDDQIKRVILILEGGLREIKAAQAHERTFGGDIREEYSAGRQASEIISIVSQLVPNVDMRGLSRSAADLDSTHAQMQLAVDIFTELPALLGVEAERDAATAAKRKAEAEDKAEKNRTTCHGRVHQGGRMVGFRRCIKKGKIEGADGKLYCCNDHALKPYREENQALNLSTRKGDAV